jgi:hypothetical protein
VNLERVAAVYIDTARTLIQEGRFASAGVILDSLSPADQQRPDIIQLRQDVWRRRIASTTGAQIDSWLTSRTLQDMQ